MVAWLVNVSLPWGSWTLHPAHVASPAACCRVPCETSYFPAVLPDKQVHSTALGGGSHRSILPSWSRQGRGKSRAGPLKEGFSEEVMLELGPGRGKRSLMARQGGNGQSGQRSLQVRVNGKPDPRPWSFGKEALSGRPTEDLCLIEAEIQGGWNTLEVFPAGSPAPAHSGAL